MRKQLFRATMVVAFAVNLGIGIFAVTAGATPGNGNAGGNGNGNGTPPSVAPTTTPPGNSGDNPGSPGDDCSHGNSNQECRPDPQPTHGQDCEDHGNAAGNEDHCLPTETPTTPPPTTPPPTTPPTTAPPTTPPSTETPTTSGPPVVEGKDVGPKGGKDQPPKAGGNPDKVRSLAFTGINDTQLKLGLMSLLTMLGFGFAALARKFAR